MIVVDASGMLAFLRGDEPQAEAVGVAIRAADEVHVPELLELEVANGLRKAVLRGDLEAGRAGQALDDFSDLDVQRWPHRALMERVWDLRHNLSAYDAAYLALAELLAATLVTLDAGLATVAARTVDVVTGQRAPGGG